ncbi:MAG: tRNA (N(6)-L-threonylcarbamoyladenosine(37)-C(2))-methylthiotransferase MtaB [Anaerolineae bacterium]|jgi:threonylcarbamoyladenosine tRNA methylthiotransferase MtaB
MDVYLDFLGCRLNQSELEDLARRFLAAGCRVVDEPAEADVCVVNTCVVTAQAERKSRHLLRSLHRANPAARIAAVGCHASLSPDELADFPGVTWVVPNEEKERTLEVVGAVERPVRGWSGEGPVVTDFRTRAFVKVQEGCDNHCTYCIVRELRGPARSRPLADVVAEIRDQVAAGRREAVLTGVNLGAYGRDLGLSYGLADLVTALLEGTDLPRLRLSSLEPWDVNQGLLNLWSNPRLCRQLHMPLQSGCDAVLRRMGRRITCDEFARLVGAARARIPDLALTTDILVGFPGETAAAFERSLAFVERTGFARLHVFPFSPRPGTSAAEMDHQVPLEARRERARRMRALGARLRRQFQERFVGREMEVLWEHRRTDGTWSGLTDNYLRVAAPGPDDLHNRITRTRLLELEEGQFVGEVIP